MTPLDQARAILKAADYVRFKTLAKTRGDLAKEDYAWIRSLPTNERSGLIDWPHEEIALALIEKHRALKEACDLFRSICAAYENQDLSHVDFRVKCAEFAQDFLARQGATHE